MTCPAVHPSGAKCGRESGHVGNHRPADTHRCHATGCMVATKPEMLMCLRHWRMVPKALQREVWKHYRPGQCDDMSISREWIAAADDAIKVVAARESVLEAQRISKAGAA